MIIRMVLIIIAMSTSAFMGAYISQNVKETRNESCYALFKGTYKNKHGTEHFNALITFSLQDRKGVIAINSSLITEGGKTTTLINNINFTYELTEKRKYSLKNISTTNKYFSNELLPAETSDFMRNLINTYFSSPDSLIIDIIKLKSGDFLVYQNVDPWFYCNKL